jgi:outer membrane receptor protein involved in Fe transport
VDPSDPSVAAEKVTPLVRTWGAEAGVRTEVLPRVQTSLALWRLDIASELLFVGDAGTTEPSRPSTRKGLEWSSRWVPLRWLLFDLDVALSRSRFTDSDPAGDHIPGSIESAVSAGVTVHELGPFSAAVFMRYFGPRPLIEDDSVRSSGATIFNAQATWRVNRFLRVNAEVLNVLDAKVDDIAYFYTSRLPGEPAEGVDDVHIHPAISRTVRASLAATF